jgi:hypothetical protein
MPVLSGLSLFQSALTGFATIGSVAAFFVGLFAFFKWVDGANPDDIGRAVNVALAVSFVPGWIAGVVVFVIAYHG